MRRTIFLLLVNLGMCAVLLSCERNTPPTKTKEPSVNPATPGEADIDFDTRVVDLGLVEPGGKKEVLVKVYNRGSKDLLVTQLKSSCGCTTTWLMGNKGPIKPKEFQELKILVESKEGKPIPPRSRITIISNDPAETTCYIDTSVTIKTYFDVEPKTLNLGQVLQGETIQSQFVVFSPEKQPIHIQKLVSQDPQVKLTLGESTVLPNNSLPGFVVKVSVDTKHRPIGNFRGLVEVHLDHDKQKTVTVNLFGIIGGEIFLKTGDRVLNVPLYDLGSIANTRGPLPLAEPRKLRVALAEKSTRPTVKILQVIGEPGPFQLEPVLDPNSLKQVELSFTNNGTRRAGLFRQHFKILVNHPSVPVLELCLQGTLQGNLTFSPEGLYVETPPNQPFEQKISIHQNLPTPPKLEIHG
ncbi:MAG: DUF1573 domain-containing protein, partial [Planctomycetota bacterium]